MQVLESADKGKQCLLRLSFGHTLLKAHTEPHAEAECYVVAAGTEDIPQCKAVVVSCLGRRTEGGTYSSPGIDEEAAEMGLIASCGQECAHLSLGARASVALVVPVVGVDEFGAYVEAFESTLFVACKEELMSIA